MGETVAFRIMEKLSTEHLRECMEPTMETTSFRLNYMYPLLNREDKELFEFMDRYIHTYTNQKSFLMSLDIYVDKLLTQIHYYCITPKFEDSQIKQKL